MKEARMRLVTDTREAKKSEKDLDRAKGRTQRLRDRAAKRLGVPLTAKAIGAAAGYRMISRFRRVGVNNVDPWTEAQVPIDARIQQEANKALGTSLKADRAARDMAASGYGAVMEDEERRVLSRRYYDFARERTTATEEGRLIMRQAIKGPTLTELTARAVAGYTKLIDEAVEWMVGEAKK